jgi:hypothetical protein
MVMPENTCHKFTPPDGFVIGFASQNNITGSGAIKSHSLTFNFYKGLHTHMNGTAQFHTKHDIKNRSLNHQTKISSQQNPKSERFFYKIAFDLTPFSLV